MTRATRSKRLLLVSVCVLWGALVSVGCAKPSAAPLAPQNNEVQQHDPDAHKTPGEHNFDLLNKISPPPGNGGGWR